MERKIGEIFKDGDVTLKVVKFGNCIKCYYRNTSCHENKFMVIRGYCSSILRSDRKEVNFVEIQESRSTGAMRILASILKFFGYKSK